MIRDRRVSEENGTRAAVQAINVATRAAHSTKRTTHRLREVPKTGKALQHCRKSPSEIVVPTRPRDLGQRIVSSDLRRWASSM